MKALLILVGGRPIPNILTAIHEKPGAIVAVCSQESFKEEWLQLKPALETLLPTASIREAEKAVDAYDVNAIKVVCEQALLTYPDAEWIVNVTTGTSLMTHGAYVAAEHCSTQKGMTIRCWFLDTGHVRVIALLGAGRDAGIFSLCVKQYITAYNYRLQHSGGYRNYRSDFLQESWMEFVASLGRNSRKIDLLKSLVENASSNKWHSVSRTDERFQFLQDMEKAGLLSKLREEVTHLHFYLSDAQQKFLNGAWLELYVYQEARRADFFNDVQWSQEIIDNDPNRKTNSPYVFKDMDVSLTFRAQLMIVECKTTSKEKLESKVLDELVTLADLVGKGAVFKVLVASQLHLNDEGEVFLAKARSKGVRVITQEELPEIGALLREQIQTARHR